MNKKKKENMPLNARKILHLSHIRIAVNAIYERELFGSSYHKIQHMLRKLHRDAFHVPFDISLSAEGCRSDTRAQVNASASGFSRSFRKTINAKKRCSAIKRISVTVTVAGWHAGIPIFNALWLRVVILLHSRRRNEIRNVCVCELNVQEYARIMEEGIISHETQRNNRNAIM